MQPPSELPEEELIRARQLVGALDDGASKIGLYPKQAQIGITDDGRTVVIMDFRFGELAFDDRVQDPAGETERDEFRALENDIVREAGIDAFLELRDRLHPDEEEPTDG